MEKCATPTINFVDDKLTFSCETDGAIFIYNIASSDVQTGSGAEVELTGTYLVKVYATKEGYENSEVVTKQIKIIGGVPGDMTGDGTVSVADVTKVVNIIIGKE